MSRRITIDGEIDNNWYDARATFYGDMTGSETMRKYNYIVIARVSGMIEFSYNPKFLMVAYNYNIYFVCCLWHRFLVSFTTAY